MTTFGVVQRAEAQDGVLHLECLIGGRTQQGIEAIVGGARVRRPLAPEGGHP
jgi:hypothetical protein